MREGLAIPETMKLICVLPLPFDAWTTFSPFVRRFIDTFKQFPPGIEDCEIWAMCCWGKPTEEVRSWFVDTKTRFVPYYDHGADIGAAQFAASQCAQNAFIAAFTSRCYFHRSGWGKRLLEARETHGEGLCGVSVSRESGKLHICTRGYCLDSDLWNEYPHLIDTRAKGQRFETGDWCVTEWAGERGLKRLQVTWDTVRDIEDAHNPDETGIFRRGEQNAMLIHDRHTDLFRDAPDQEKRRLERLCFEGSQ